MKIISCMLLSLGLFTGSAGAADLVMPDPVPPPQPMQPKPTSFDWTGPYIGIFGAIEEGTNAYRLQPGPPDQVVATDFSDTAGGGLFGAQIGYDYQFNRIVVGGLADIGFSTYKARVTLDYDITSAEAKSELEYLGTVQARLGYAFDNMLFYAHGGLAYGKTKLSYDVNGTNLLSLSSTKTGYTVGAGVEYAFTKHLSFETEYSYVNLGKDTVYDNPRSGAYLTEDVHFHQLKAALNYRF